MGYDERDLRRALADRSGSSSADFRLRLSDALAAGPPPRSRAGGGEWALAAAVVLLALLPVSVLLGSRLAPGVRQTPAMKVPSTLTPTGEPSAAAMAGASVESIQFISAQQGWMRLRWAQGQDLVATTDGTHYAEQFAVPSGSWALDQRMSFVDAKRGVIFTDTAELRTGDGGKQWTPVDPGFPVGLVRSVSFTPTGEGWVLLTGSPQTQCSAQIASVYHTTDLGLTWTRLAASGLDERQCKTEISFRDSLHGWITTQAPNGAQRVFSTVDGGRSWRAFVLPGSTADAGSGPQLHLPVMFDARNGVLPAVLEPDRGFGYWRTTDGGATWTGPLTVGLTSGRVGVTWDFLNSTRWWVTAGPLVAWSTNGGATWITSDASAAGVEQFVEFDVVTGQTIWALGRSGSTGVLVRSDDGGAHWREVPVG